MAATTFLYNAEHRVVVCRPCGTCLMPGGSWQRHLRAEPHGLRGDRLKRVLDLLSTYELRGRDELRRQRPSRRAPCEAIAGLATHGGYLCACDAEGCDFATTRLARMHDYMPRHGRTAAQHSEEAPLWRSVTLQTYSAAKQLVDYFVVVGAGPARQQQQQQQQQGSAGASPEQRRVFDGLREDMGRVGGEVDARAAVVEDPGQGRADRERWLVHTGFPTHLRGLADAEIESSFRLPTRRRTMTVSPLQAKTKGKAVLQARGARGRDEFEAAGNGEDNDSDSSDGRSYYDDDDDGEEDLQRILKAVDAWLWRANRLVADSSTQRRMTHQRAQTLSDFAAGAGKKGRDIAFRSFKRVPTLETYFRRMKQLLVYYYRVVYREDGHFSRDAAAPAPPQDVIEPTARQEEAMAMIHEALREQDRGLGAKRAARGAGEGRGGDSEGEGKDEEPLVAAIREFYVALICQTVGSAHFRSPVISFCAMLSRARLPGGRGERGRAERQAAAKGTGDDELDRAATRRKALRCWHDPGNYSSTLSALIWCAQLVLFESVCVREQDDEDGIPAALARVCGDFMHQKGETTFGYILQWRLYLTTVARSAVSRRQARWSLCGERIVYLGTSLRMTDVTKVIVSEYRRARTLLYDALLFGAKGSIGAIEAWRLVDDLDAEDYGGSWLTDERNADVLQGTQDALLRLVEARADLRSVFAPASSRRPGLCEQATAAYEADVQEFLQSINTLLLISPMPPLRAPEFLSITATNSASRRRSLLLWEKELMIHVRYRKSVEQTGKDGDNIRFVPAAISELVLTFLAVVQPLRLCFLRQAEPGALLSPHLFSRVDGTVWPDEAVSRCLSRACARAEVPEFKLAWWRQAAASITKEKFTPRDRANFDLEDVDGRDEAVDDEDLLVDLAEGSNHSFRTFNHAYAGSSTLAMNTVLHRAHRASTCWRTLFRVDEVLAREMAAAAAGPGGGGLKRPGAAAETVLDAYKKARTRTRPQVAEGDLVAAARRLHNDPDLQLRRPGQRDAMLAAMGPRAAEQVVVVLATGSGKTLVVMVAAVLPGARTTMLILPTVALRTDMMARLARSGVRAMEWVPGERRAAPLVIVSAEAACTRGFLDYAHRLEGQQRLDRIVVDECHLTVTATFRRSMTQLGSYVRQIRTQTVWLTATLPPAFEEAFLRRNLLVRPRVVRESTNRPGIRYSITRYKGPGGLCDRAADLVQTLLRHRHEGRAAAAQEGEGEGDRMIVYCPTLELVDELSEALGCAVYTGEREATSSEERLAALDRWLGPAGSPVIVATSALGVGFDYPRVRWVVHAGPPRRMTDFAQESGRAGRDGRAAESIVLLSAAWQPGAPADLDDDEASMQLYLSRQGHCLRAVMSQFLDQPQDWRWCMGDEVLCGACTEPHAEPRPPGPPLTLEAGSTGPAREAAPTTARESVALAGGATAMEYTGPAEVLRQARQDDEAVARLEASLEALRGSCLLCRVEGRQPSDHGAASCARRWSWIRAKSKTLRDCRGEGKPWMAKYTACFVCYLPQVVCRRADPEARAEDDIAAEECRFRDMIMPLCYGAFFQAGPRGLIKKHFPRTFRNVDDYMRWLGEPTELGGSPCTQAVQVADMLLREMLCS